MRNYGTQTQPLYQAIATEIQRYHSIEDAATRFGWTVEDKSSMSAQISDSLDSLQSLLASGSGFNCGSKIDLDKSKPERLQINTEFHHMNDGGYYDGWTDHAVTVRPSLAAGFDMSIGGRNLNDIKEYIASVFDYDLNRQVRQYYDADKDESGYVEVYIPRMMAL